MMQINILLSSTEMWQFGGLAYFQYKTKKLQNPLFSWD